MGKSVSLVLGSGGARGYAHIGVIEVLQENGYEIRALVGSSMGALIGGLYANGTLGEYKEWVRTLDFFNVLRLVDFSFGRAGMIKGDRVFDRMAYLLGDTRIEDLPLDYTAVATDISRLREVWFQRGSLRQAIRASIAIPMLFTPVVIDGRILVDGGLLNPLPVAPTVSHHTDLVIAVNLNAVARHLNEVRADAGDGAQRGPPGQDDENNGLSRFLTSIGWSVKSSDRVELGRFELMSRAFEAMQQTLSSYKLAGYAPDLKIDIPSGACNFYDFHKADAVIQIGRDAARSALDTLRGRV